MTVKDTHALIAGMTPVLDPDTWVFCSIDSAATLPNDAFAIIREPEGITVILAQEAAKAAGYASSPSMRRITLQVLSDLEGVGLTAAVATALADISIPCNVVAGYHHDHIFVPHADADRALAALKAVQDAAR